VQKRYGSVLAAFCCSGLGESGPVGGILGSNLAEAGFVVPPLDELSFADYFGHYLVPMFWEREGGVTKKTNLTFQPQELALLKALLCHCVPTYISFGPAPSRHSSRVARHPVAPMVTAHLT
jgi:hypothetical protein